MHVRPSHRSSIRSATFRGPILTCLHLGPLQTPRVPLVSASCCTTQDPRQQQRLAGGGNPVQKINLNVFVAWQFWKLSMPNYIFPDKKNNDVCKWSASSTTAWKKQKSFLCSNFEKGCVNIFMKFNKINILKYRY